MKTILAKLILKIIDVISIIAFYELGKFIARH